MLLPKTRKKYLGQHFLMDKNFIEKIVNFLKLDPLDHFIEIGPGAGNLTIHLLEKLELLHVIEFDHEIIPLLKQNCNYSPKLKIYQEDVLKVDFGQFRSPFRIVGNLPYNISTPILFHLVRSNQMISDMHLMFQREVAERIVATPGSKVYGRLSVMMQYYFKTEMVLQVPPQVFSPPPKIDSIFIRFIPKKLPALDNQLFGDIVRTAFTMRRKTLGNAVGRYITPSQLMTLGIDPKLRPENLDIDAFMKITKNVTKSVLF